MPLHQALFVEPNPTGIKYAASVIGKMTDEVRLPLVKTAESTRTGIRSAMVHAGLIN
jgi:4-hydroxy-tetrahydrodipicolinate synthase